MRVVLSNGPMFTVSREALSYLWEHHREFFDEPIEPQEVMLGRTGRTLEEQYCWAVEREGMGWFLNLRDTQLRSLPWLLERVESGAEAGNDLRIAEIPDDGREWYLLSEDDGSEWVTYYAPVW